MAFPWPHPIYQIERMFGKGKLWEIWQITSNLPNSIPQICYSQTISCTTCNLKCQSWSTFSMCSEAFRWLITRSKWLIVLKIAFLSNTTMWVHQLKGRLLKEGGAILNFDTFTEILSREESIGKRCNFYPMKLFQAFSWSSTKRNFSKDEHRASVRSLRVDIPIEDVQELPSKKTGRPLLVNDLDEQVRQYVKYLRECSTVNTAVHGYCSWRGMLVCCLLTVAEFVWLRIGIKTWWNAWKIIGVMKG